MIRQFLALPICFLALPVDIQAEELFPDFLPELPVVISASRLNQSVLSSPSAVTVIDSDMIEASGFIEFADIMRLVPGFIVANVDGGTQAVISHGEGWEYPNRMQLLIDGRSTYTPALSGIDWNTLGIHIEDIDHIEVVRGPAASAYGSNSYAGAINIITKAPELDDKLNLRARIGNKGEQELLLRHSGKTQDLSYRVSASTRQNNGFNQYRDDRNMGNLSLSGRLTIDPQNSLWSNFSYNHGRVQAPNLAPSLTQGFLDSDRQVEAMSVNLRWDHQFSSQQSFKVNFFHNYLDENDLAHTNLISDFTPVIVSVIGEPNQSLVAGKRTYHNHRSDIEFQYSQINDSGMQYVIGSGARYDTMRSKAFFPHAGTVSNMGYRFFGNIQLPVTRFLTANVGSLYEINQTERPHLSPRASLNFHLDQLQAIRLGYSQAYRIPSLLEEYIDADLYLNSGTVVDKLYVSSDDLKAEQVTSVDISYLGRFDTLPINWEFRAYREEYKNSITFYNDFNDTDYIADGLTRIGNGAASTMYGLDGEITFRPEKSSFIRLNFNLGHMTGWLLTDINRPAPYTATNIISLENRAPHHSIGFLAAKQIGTWQFNLGYYRVGKMKWSSNGTQVHQYNRVDTSIIKKIPLSNKQVLTFKIAGQNVFNNKIHEFNERSTGYDFAFEPRYYSSITLTYF